MQICLATMQNILLAILHRMVFFIILCHQPIPRYASLCFWVQIKPLDKGSISEERSVGKERNSQCKSALRQCKMFSFRFCIEWFFLLFIYYKLIRRNASLVFLLY